MNKNYYLITHKLAQYFKCKYCFFYGKWKGLKEQDYDALQALAEFCREQDINPFDFCFLQFEELRTFLPGYFSPTYFVTENAMLRYLKKKEENIQTHKGTLTAQNDFKKLEGYYQAFKNDSKEQLDFKVIMQEMDMNQYQKITSLFKHDKDNKFLLAYSGVKIALSFYSSWKDLFYIVEGTNKFITLFDFEQHNLTN